MAEVLVWVLIVVSAAVGIGALVAMARTLSGLRAIDKEQR